MSRLADASSPYLRDAADQPVDWRTWSDEAFEEARAEDKPVLLDSGAVWCHWCHVMDHESYEDPDVAAYINEHFIPIKLDRDARPDVDARFQEAVGAMTGQGGWPLTVFLTPEGKPFYGGTYFPPEPKMGRPSLRQVLEAVVDQYENKTGDVTARAEKLVGAIRARTDPKPGEVDPFHLDRGLEGIRAQSDSRHGGFGDAPKFPHPPALDLLLAEAWRTGDDGPLDVVRRTLAGMADGGVHDHLGGGFHRYSTDRAWLVPHFEKMAYDNAGLMRSYADAYAWTGTDRWGDVAARTADHVLEVSTGPALYGSQDADVGPGDDGSYWTWTPDEVRDATPDHADLLIRHFGVTDEGNMPHGDRTVLHRAETAEDLAGTLDATAEDVQKRLAEGRVQMLEARRAREAPFVDTTPYAAWVGLLVQGLHGVAWRLGDRNLGGTAREPLDLVLEEMTTDEGVHHVLHDGPEVPGLLEDNVHVGRACVAAYQDTGERRYLEAAHRLADLLVGSFQAEDGAFMDHAPNLVDVPLGPRYPVHDNPTPSPNGSAILFLDEIARLTGETSYGDAGRDALEATIGSAGTNVHGATLLGALWCHVHDPPTAVVFGDPDDETTEALHRKALAAYAPWKVVLPPGHDRVPEAAREAGDGVVVCRGRSCKTPATEPDQVADRLAGP